MPKISKKTLTKWRKEALNANCSFNKLKEKGHTTYSTDIKSAIDNFERILLLTQELLDQHLIKEE